MFPWARSLCMEGGQYLPARAYAHPWSASPASTAISVLHRTTLCLPLPAATKPETKQLTSRKALKRRVVTERLKCYLKKKKKRAERHWNGVSGARMEPWEEGRGFSSQGSQKSPYVLWSQRLQGCWWPPCFYLLLICLPMAVCQDTLDESFLKELLLLPSPSVAQPWPSLCRAAGKAVRPRLWSGTRISLSASYFFHFLPSPHWTNTANHYNSTFSPKWHILLSLFCSDRQPDWLYRTVNLQHGAKCFLIPCFPTQFSLHTLLSPELSERGEGWHVHQSWRWWLNS